MKAAARKHNEALLAKKKENQSRPLFEERGRRGRSTKMKDDPRIDLPQENRQERGLIRDRKSLFLFLLVEEKKKGLIRRVSLLLGPREDLKGGRKIGCLRNEEDRGSL